MVTLQLDIHVLMPVDRNQLIHEPAACFFSTTHQRRSQWSFVASGQADKAFGVLLQIVQRCRAFALVRLAQLEGRDELAEVLVAGSKCAEERQA